MTVLMISQVLLWAVVIVLGMICLALARQVGVLHERLAPAGALAMNQNVKAGDAAPSAPVATLDGRTIMFGENKRWKSELLFFLSPDCPVCKTLLPALKSFQKTEKDWLDITFASDGEVASHEAFVAAENLDPSRYFVSEQLGRAFGVSKLPYAVLIGEDGKIASLGLVNTREHLESLVEAKERGVASIQDYMKKRNQ